MLSFVKVHSSFRAGERASDRARVRDRLDGCPLMTAFSIESSWLARSGISLSVVARARAKRDLWASQPPVD